MEVEILLELLRDVELEGQEFTGLTESYAEPVALRGPEYPDVRVAFLGVVTTAV